MDDFNSPIAANYFLRPGFILMAAKPTVISTVLGSCVAVCIYDRKRKIGGMNHYQLPYTDKKDQTTAVYGNVATLALVRMLIAHGSSDKHLEAQIFGGAYNPEVSSLDIGIDNVTMARKVLNRKRIAIVSEDTGGRKGRKVVFNTSTNEIGVLKVEKLREMDWYPYENTR